MRKKIIYNYKNKKKRKKEKKKHFFVNIIIIGKGNSIHNSFIKNYRSIYYLKFNKLCEIILNLLTLYMISYLN